jgi:hypothetical protein
MKVTILESDKVYSTGRSKAYNHAVFRIHSRFVNLEHAWLSFVTNEMKAAMYELILHEAGIFVGKGKKNVRSRTPIRYLRILKTPRKPLNVITEPKQNSWRTNSVRSSTSQLEVENTTLRGLRKGIR